MRDVSARFSHFRTASRTVVALALYFTVQTLLTSKASNTSIKISFDIAKRTIHLAIQTAIDNYVFLFFYFCFLFSVLSLGFVFSIFYFTVLHLQYFAWSLSLIHI